MALLKSLQLWFNSYGAIESTSSAESKSSAEPKQSANTSTGIDMVRIVPFIFIHLACLGVLWVGWSPIAVAVAVFMYVIRMFAITAFYHRYFSHKTFKTGRKTQFIFALLGASATQRGPLWWAAHHRQHHRASDTDADPHSSQKGFLWSHILWFLSNQHFYADYERVKDWKKYPELIWLDRFDMAVPFLLAVFMFCLGGLLNSIFPQWGTSALQMLIWGYFISTVALLHATLSINSLSHRWGKRRYKTDDDSRNNFILALLTLGEGWHNNHHYHQGSAQQGFFWWEIDISYYVIRFMEQLGLVWDVKSVPLSKRDNRDALYFPTKTSTNHKAQQGEH